MKKYAMPVVMLAVFETVAVILWLTKGNLFYLFNFSYIGISVSLGVFLFIKQYKHARRIVQLLVGLYMLVYLGLICNENMQIEGFWYYLFTGVFEAATIHYAVAKIFGPLIFGRGWCGYACWTAMVLDFLPYKVPKHPRKQLGWIRYITFAAPHSSLLRHCSLRMLGTSGGLCSGRSSLAISCIMRQGLSSHLYSGTTVRFANISVRLQYS